MAASEHSLAANAKHLWNKRFYQNEQDPSYPCFVSQILKLIWLSSWLLVLTWGKQQEYEIGSSKGGASLSRAAQAWTRICWS